MVEYKISDIENFLSLIKALFERIEILNYDFPSHYEEIIIKSFVPIKVFHSICEGIFPSIERVTVNKRVLEGNNVRIDKVNKLKYPPSECITKYSRANLKHQSVFYGTFNFMTAVKEIKPEIGDLITVSEWTTKSETCNLIVCPIFMKQPKHGTINNRLLNMYNSFMLDLKRFPPEISRLIFEIHTFYANCFSRKIDSDNNQGYLYTALLSDKILNQYNGGCVDAILYPSTQEDLRTENIAIKKDSFDKKYVLSKTTEKRLVDLSKDGNKYIFELLGRSQKIDGETILWK